MPVRNVKVSWRLPANPSFPQRGHQTLKLKGYTYTLFHHGFVNCTGIPTLDKVEDAVEVFLQSLGLESSSLLDSVVVDNITYSERTGHAVDLWHLVQKAVGLTRPASLLLARYNPQVFPGATLKFEPRGTIVCFASGAYNILGCTNLEDIERVEEIYLHDLLEDSM